VSADFALEPQLTFRQHHVGFLVKDIRRAAQEFTTRLGYVIESDVIEDSVQTAQVQFLRQSGTFSWLELVTPIDAQSKLANALKKGGGWHHLCYEVGDIERACAYLRDKAMLPLAEPVLATAFPGRRIAWLMDRTGLLVELLEQGSGPLSLMSLAVCQEDIR
jgi:methylmalonyl-CoA/ethylmalonyl-CoA epimerase